MTIKSDDFGERMKDFEFHETKRTFLKGLPVIARLDGRGFSHFTKGMKRPYDERMSKLMTATTVYLIKETNAIFGYVQSDEISLVFFNDEQKGDIFFNRRITKMNSVLAGMTSSYFALNICNFFGDDSEKYESKLPHFDCRVMQFPSKTEASNMILWRCADAFKNSVSMAAQSEFSHKSLQNMNTSQMQERLFQERGINHAKYPSYFRQGSFFAKRYVEQPLGDDILAKIPEHKRADAPKTVVRSKIDEIDMPVFNKVINRTEVIFDGAEPKVLTT